VEEQSKINPSLEYEIGGNLQTNNEEIVQQHFKKLHS